MKHVFRNLATYSADWAGVCSALYELGGLQVIHDASGCNSTYTTFDEPRWYEMDSHFYISALVEMDAVLGQGDNKLIADISEAAEGLAPKFIAISGSPIPMMSGTDFDGIANLLEKRVGIPSFGFATNGMSYYPKGVSAAMKKLAERFCSDDVSPQPIKNGELAINIIGATPLDFSITGNVPELHSWVEKQGFKCISCWTMGCNLGDISRSGEAHVNLVVSAGGLAAAKVLKRKYGTPYVVGIPVGKNSSEQLSAALKKAAKTKECFAFTATSDTEEKDKKALVIGEQVFSNALRNCLAADFGLNDITVLCPLFPEKTLCADNDIITDTEADIKEIMKDYDIIVADPIYRRILSSNQNCIFIDMPHEAFSSRVYREQIPVIISEKANDYFEKYL